MLELSFDHRISDSVTLENLESREAPTVAVGFAIRGRLQPLLDLLLPFALKGWRTPGSVMDLDLAGLEPLMLVLSQQNTHLGMQGKTSASGLCERECLKSQDSLVQVFHSHPCSSLKLRAIRSNNGAHELPLLHCNVIQPLRSPLLIEQLDLHSKDKLAKLAYGDEYLKHNGQSTVWARAIWAIPESCHQAPEK